MAKGSKKAKSSAKSSKKASKSSKPAKKIKPAKKVAAKKPAKPAAKKVKKPVAKKPVKTAKKVAKVSKPAAKKEAVTKRNAVILQHNKLAPKSEGRNIVKSMINHMSHGKKGRDTILKTRYSDKELEEFRQLILEKLEAAKNELKYLQDQISHKGENNTGDTENTFASSDDGSNSMEREYLTQMAARQRLYIDHLDKALIRIANKTYGICRVTGKLIEKERLRAVPHATLSMEAKLMQSHPQSQNV